MSTTANDRIATLHSLSTGEMAQPHFIGIDREGRRLVQFVDGWQPYSGNGRCVYPEQDGDGNWIEGTECEPYTFE